MTLASLRTYDDMPQSAPAFDNSSFLELMSLGLSRLPTDDGLLTPADTSLVVAPDVDNPPAIRADETDLPPDLKLPSGWYAEEEAPKAALFPLKAATIGFVAGLLLLIPASILWSKATPQAGPSADDLARLAITIVAEATAHAGRLAPGPAFDQARVERIAARTLTAPTFEPHLDEARRLIAAKDIQGARDVLATAAAAKSPRALFAIAETFDPNLLAAWGVSGVNADPERARANYTAARSLGHEGAKGRLDALQ